MALLESAIFRPQTTFSDEELYSTIFEKAAALMHSLMMNHPFIDGNKRTGVVSTLVFLELNGFSLKVEQDELINKVLQLENKSLTIEQIAEWLSEYSELI